MTLSNYILSNGRIYSADELRHAGKYKYVKREWRNGRWVYWYDDPKKKNPIKLDYEGFPKETQDAMAAELRERENFQAARNASARATVAKNTTISKEYLEELGYNGRKSTYSTIADESPNKSTKTPVSKTIDEEYRKNLESNSQKNTYDAKVSADKSVEKGKQWVKTTTERNDTKIVRKKDGSYYFTFEEPKKKKK